MKIIKPSFELRTWVGPLTPEDGIKMLRWVEWNARISHRTEDAQTEDSWRRFLDAVIVKHGDWSVAEHAHVTAVLRTERGSSHEIVRHRLASIDDDWDASETDWSYTQESTRFVNYGRREIELIVPDGLKPENEQSWMDAMARVCREYVWQLKCGQRPQEARSVLPTCMATTISMTSNFRNWRLFFMSRITNETHPDVRRLTIPMLAEFKRCIPLLFDDLEAEVKQSISLAKAR